MLRVVFILLLCLSPQLMAYEFYAGAASGYRSLMITDSQQDADIAEFEERGNDSLRLSASLVSSPRYIWQDANWGYVLSADFFTSKFTTQRLASSSDKSKDVGTRVRGVSAYLTPLVYYHFNRGATSGWHYKAGFGLGVGYQKYHGQFLVSAPEHTNFNQLKSIAHHRVGISGELYVAASYGRHRLLLGSSTLWGSATHTDEQYTEQNISLGYQYRLFSFSLF